MSNNSIEQFKLNDRVIYIPRHVGKDRSHPDCRRGSVSSVNDHYVFVRFDEQVSKLGWEGTTAQGCRPDQLEIETHE